MLSAFRSAGVVAPLLSCAASTALEARFFAGAGREAAAERAMRMAGQAVGRALAKDIRAFNASDGALQLLLLVLAGRGMNTADGLMAAAAVIAEHPLQHHLAAPSVTILHTCDTPRLWAPSAFRAYTTLVETAGCRRTEYVARFGSQLAGDTGAFTVHEHHLDSLSADEIAALWQDRVMQPSGDERFVVALDAVFGMNFRGQLSGAAKSVLALANSDTRIALRAAVDVPSGFSDAAPAEGAFVADITYATGIAKTCVLNTPQQSGRLRFVDIDFFAPRSLFNVNAEAGLAGADEFVAAHLAAGTAAAPSFFIASTKMLAPVARPTVCHKTTFGHALIVAGTAEMPGACLMAVQAALRSGVGLVSVLAPPEVAASGAALCNEAMWIPLNIADSDAVDTFAQLLSGGGRRFTSALIGPGLGRSRAAQRFIHGAARLLLRGNVHTVLDADALQPELVDALLDELQQQQQAAAAGTSSFVLTPHAGELARLVSNLQPGSGAAALQHHLGARCIVVEKGPRTCVWASSSTDQACVGTYIPAGGPVLARGGSGDVLAGVVVGALSAEASSLSTYEAVIKASLRVAVAADESARVHGECAAKTTDLLAFLR